MHMASHGWLVVDADYRLSPSARMPDHIVDVKRAIAWTREHAADYGGDPRFIVITGGSAGGHRSHSAALTANQREWQPGFEDADTRVQGWCPSRQVRPARRVQAGTATSPPTTEKVFPARARRTTGCGGDAPGQPREAARRRRRAAAVPRAARDPRRADPARRGALVRRLLRAGYAGEVVTPRCPRPPWLGQFPHSLRADLTAEALQRYLELQYARWCRRHGVTPTPAAQPPRRRRRRAWRAGDERLRRGQTAVIDDLASVLVPHAAGCARHADAARWRSAA